MRFSSAGGQSQDCFLLFSVHLAGALYLARLCVPPPLTPNVPPFATVYFCSSCLRSADPKSRPVVSAGYKVTKIRNGGVCDARFVVRGRPRGEGGVRCVTQTEKTALDHSTNMSTEIKLVYYFQRGEGGVGITKQKGSHILH